MTTTTPMACGNCGNGLFRISRPIDTTDQLHAECASCNSASVITVPKPALQIDWGEGAHGILCEMAPSMEQVTPPEPPAPPPPPPPICKPDQCKWQDDGKGGSTCITCGDWLPF